MSAAQKLRELLEAKQGAVQRRNFFEVLEVSETATPPEVQRAYFRLAKVLHPDRVSKLDITDAERQRARQLFEFVTLAFQTLSDPSKKATLVAAMRRNAGNPFIQTPLSERIKQDEGKIYYHKGTKLLQMRAFDRAEEALRRAAAKSPDDPAVLTQLGWAMFNNPKRTEQQRLEGARECWARAIELAPTAPRTLYYMSLYHKMRGEVRQQRMLLEAALREDPQMVEAQRELRLLRMRSNRSERRSLLTALFGRGGRKGRK